MRTMTRPSIALREISPPQVGPTSCTLMSSTEIPACFARACFRSATSAAPVVAVPLGEAEAAGEAEGDADALGLGLPEALGAGVAGAASLRDGGGVGSVVPFPVWAPGAPP